MNDLLPSVQKHPKIDHHRSIVLIGSCFSQHIGDRLKQAGFSTLSNPFGTIFHPHPLANCLKRILEPRTERLFRRDDIWLSYDASSELYAFSEHQLLERLAVADQQLADFLSRAGTLIITFGSAHGYRLQTDSQLVANCHRQPRGLFEKTLTELDELTAVWQPLLGLLHTRFPELNILLTVSPVRYSRDGWIENNRSKARLLQLAEQLEQLPRVSYFPAYELVNDVLRDYRYFESDGVHPNAQAIEATWKLFAEWYFSVETTDLVGQALAIRNLEAHRLLFPDSLEAQRFRKQLHEKRESFLSLHPYIQWS